jgi:CheY-like chemotaxis protein
VPASSSNVLAGGELAGLDVLLAEDDPDARELLADLVRMAGATVRAARDGEEALAEFDRARPDVLVSDLYMPRVDGFELVRRVRARPPEEGGLTPAIAVTAGIETEERTLLAGFHVHLAKPCDPMVLLRTLGAFAATKRESKDDRAQAQWTLQERPPKAPGGVPELVLTWRGHVTASTMREMTRALLVHLERGPVTLVNDLRGLVEFDPAAPSVAERAVWKRRDRLKKVVIVGGRRLPRLVSMAALTLLGVPFEIAGDPPPPSS